MRFSLVSVWKTETKMGTYTTNYNLFMPTIGEQGWGELVNNNFSTIDTAMAGMNMRIGALEPLSAIHVDENQNVTFPGKVVANEIVGGIVDFGSIVMPTLSYEGFTTFTPMNDNTALGGDMEGLTIFASPFPISGKVSIARVGGSNGRAYLIINSTSGVTKTDISTTQTEYTVINAFTICVNLFHGYGSVVRISVTYGIPKLITS